MFSFPDLTAQCSKCHRRTVVQAVGRTCQMPQLDGSVCLGVFRSPEKPKSHQTVFFTAEEAERTNPFPPPKVVLSDRAKEAAAAAYDECEKGPRKSMQYAVEAAAGIIVADNLTAIRIGIDSAIGLLGLIGRASDARMMRSVADMLDEYIVALDPNRPTDD